jgi:hypothetical protein
MKNLILIIASVFLFCSPILGQTPIPKRYGTEFNEVSIDKYEMFLAHACSLGCAIDWEFAATSTLKSQNGNSYSPDKLGDFQLKTAWVEGSIGYGIGEKIIIKMKLSKDFKDVPFRGMQFINGYAKDDRIWNANSRVKTLKLYHNSQPKFLIELMDTKVPQEVSFKPIMINYGDVVSLEILEVYPGKKYKDTALSEINLYGAH